MIYSTVSICIYSYVYHVCIHAYPRVCTYVRYIRVPIVYVESMKPCVRVYTRNWHVHEGDEGKELFRSERTVIGS